jgi:hypothetical protein
MNSTIEVPITETETFANLVSNLYNWGVKFQAKMVCGHWEIEIVG